MTKGWRMLLMVLVGFSVTISCASNGKPPNQPPHSAPIGQSAPGLSLEIPDARWEPLFFEALEERSTKAGMSSLRRTVLPDHDLEVRFWYDRLEVISGVIIQRSGEEWSATYLHQKYDHVPSSVQLENLGAPKSGWETAWKSLTSAGILTLPDGSTKCKSEGLDGTSYVVETNVNRKYRTYRYGNPQFADCDEAKRMMQIESIIAEEFRRSRTECR